MFVNCAGNHERLHMKHGVRGAPSHAQLEAIQRSADARDYCLDTRDVVNLRVNVEYEQFMHHSSDAESLSIKVQLSSCVDL
jgi:hypothetical protein